MCLRLELLRSVFHLGQRWALSTDVPTDSIRIVGWEDTTTAVANGRIVLNTFTGGVIQVLDQAFTGDFATAVVPKNEWVRVDYDLIAHPTQGVVEARLYQGDSVHPVTNGVVRITGKNTASVVNRVTHGANAAWSAAAMSFWMDDAKTYAPSRVRSPSLDFDYSR